MLERVKAACSPEDGGLLLFLHPSAVLAEAKHLSLSSRSPLTFAVGGCLVCRLFRLALLRLCIGLIINNCCSSQQKGSDFLLGFYGATGQSRNVTLLESPLPAWCSMERPPQQGGGGQWETRSSPRRPYLRRGSQAIGMLRWTGRQRESLLFRRILVPAV